MGTLSHLLDEETEAQKEEVIHPSSHSLKIWAGILGELDDSKELPSHKVSHLAGKESWKKELV